MHQGRGGEVEEGTTALTSSAGHPTNLPFRSADGEPLAKLKLTRLEPTEHLLGISAISCVLTEMFDFSAAAQAPSFELLP